MIDNLIICFWVGHIFWEGLLSIILFVDFHVQGGPKVLLPLHIVLTCIIFCLNIMHNRDDYNGFLLPLSVYSACQCTTFSTCQLALISADLTSCNKLYYQEESFTPVVSPLSWRRSFWGDTLQQSTNCTSKRLHRTRQSMDMKMMVFIQTFRCVTVLLEVNKLNPLHVLL